MSAALPGDGPVARIRLEALAANAAAWVGPDAIADLRADACGHGAAACAATLVAVGIRQAAADRVDHESISLAGLEVLDAEPTIVPEALYGLTGVGHPVMRFSGRVLAVKRLLAGEGVSYGYRYRAPVDTHVALVSGGYAQGVVRSLGDRAVVAIEGVRHPIVGRVAMDVCVVDIGDASVTRGADAVFFGDRRSGEPVVAEWSSATDMRATELVTAVGAKARRVLA